MTQPLTEQLTKRRPVVKTKSEDLEPRTPGCDTQCRQDAAAAMSANAERFGSHEYFSADGADGARLVFHSSPASQEIGYNLMAEFSHTGVEKKLRSAGFTKFVLTDDREKMFEWDLP